MTGARDSGDRAPLAVLLFLLSLRRAGECAGRMAHRLDTMERADTVHRRMPDAAARSGLAIATGRLAACATEQF